jgi:hypothetical protein
VSIKRLDVFSLFLFFEKKIKKREPAGEKDKKQKERLGFCKHELKKTELETSALKKIKNKKR